MRRKIRINHNTYNNLIVAADCGRNKEKAADTVSSISDFLVECIFYSTIDFECQECLLFRAMKIKLPLLFSHILAY